MDPARRERSVSKRPAEPFLKLLKRVRIEPRRLVDQPLPCVAHAVAAEHGLDLVAVHLVADQTLMPLQDGHRTLRQDQSGIADTGVTARCCGGPAPRIATTSLTAIWAVDLDLVDRAGRRRGEHNGDDRQERRSPDWSG
jgi:hypothetical protein